MKKMYNNPTTETVELLTGNELLVVSMGPIAGEGQDGEAPARGKGTPIE